MGGEVGWFKEVKTEMGGRETTFAFATVDGAGHMVPFDRPDVALGLVRRWLGGEEFCVGDAREGVTFVCRTLCVRYK